MTCAVAKPRVRGWLAVLRSAVIWLVLLSWSDGARDFLHAPCACGHIVMRALCSRLSDVELGADRAD